MSGRKRPMVVSMQCDGGVWRWRNGPVRAGDENRPGAIRPRPLRADISAPGGLPHPESQGVFLNRTA